MKILPILTVILSLSWAGAYAARLLSEEGLTGHLLAQAQQPASGDESQSASPAGDQANTTEQPAQLLRQSRDALVRHQPFRANVVETVALGARKFRMSGTYLQGTDLKLRLEFKVDVGSLTGTLLEVCNGQVLWTRQQVTESDPDSESRVPQVGRPITFTRRDVGQILKTAAEHPWTQENFLVAELGLGGLSALLASLEQKIKFESVSSEEIDGHQLRVIEGGWVEPFRERWAATNQEDPTQLPAYIPDRVRVYFDADSLFPRRILYLKGQGEDPVDRPMVTLDFNDVVFNASIDPKLFEYVPPDGITPEDITDQYLRRLQPGPATPPAQASP